MSRHELCKVAAPSMSRHAMCKVQTNHRPKISIPIQSNAGIFGQVRKVSADVSELQKHMAQESAARNELQVCVEKLKAETAEAKQLMAQAIKDGAGVRRRSDSKGTLRVFMKTMPCKSLDELDWLLDYIENRSTYWTEYLKLLGGSDFNLAIKTCINTILDRSLQKQLSWSGQRSKKPSLKTQYRGIVDGIHVAMKDVFKDYTIVQGEVKMQSMLRNAAK